MKLITISGLLFLLISSASGSAWPQYMHDAQNTGKTQITIQEDLALSWTYSPPQAAPGWQWNQPSLDDNGNIYYAAGYYFVSLDPEGNLRWSVQTPHVFMGPPALNNGSVYFPCSDGSLYAYTQDGTELWAYPMIHPVNGGPTIGSDGTIYIGDSITETVFTSYLSALNPDGSEKWKVSFENADGFNTASALDPSGSTIYAIPGDSEIHSIDTATGNKIWSYEYNSIMNIVYSSPSVAQFDSNKFILFGDLGNMSGGHWRILDGDGTERWTTSISNSVQQTAAIDPSGFFYFASNGSMLKKVDTSGTEIWSRSFSQGYLSNPIIEGSGKVLIGTESGLLHILDPNTGTTIQSFNLGSDVGSPIVGSNGEVYVIYGNGILACLETQSSINNDTPDPFSENLLQVSRTGSTYKISIGNETGQCSIYNTSGRSVLTQTINNNLYWNTSEYPAGIYLVRVSTSVNGELFEDSAKLLVIK